MSIFIQITISKGQLSNEQSARIESACPLDIFYIKDEALQINEDMEDECILCGLCLSIAPPGSVLICKKYKGELLDPLGA